jgi:hypothetical protein
VIYLVRSEVIILTTISIETEVSLSENPGDLPRLVEAALRKWGEPLRWAIVSVDRDRLLVRVEAIVTTKLST